MDLILPILTKAGPIRSMRSVCWYPAEASIVDRLVHTHMVGNIFLVDLITVLDGSFSARFQEQLPRLTATGCFSLKEISLDIACGVITL